MNKQFNELRFAIVGLGLLGGSIAWKLHSEKIAVYAIDNNQESINYGIKNNIIDGGTINVDEFDFNIDVLICALYPHVFVEWIKKYQHLLRPKTIILDVTGIKKYVFDEIEPILREDLIFVGTHPMAGREVYGVENANKDLFKGANYIIVPSKYSTKEAIDVALQLGNILEVGKMPIITKEVHDEMIGFLSQLTHCIAVSLMTCKDSVHLVEYTGDSFRDLTRIAKINEDMWTELFLLNKKELVYQMDLFLNQFVKLRDYIDNEEIDKIKDMMKLSTKRRSYFDK